MGFHVDDSGRGRRTPPTGFGICGTRAACQEKRLANCFQVCEVTSELRPDRPYGVRRGVRGDSTSDLVEWSKVMPLFAVFAFGMICGAFIVLAFAFWEDL